MHSPLCHPRSLSRERLGLLQGPVPVAHLAWEDQSTTSFQEQTVPNTDAFFGWQPAPLWGWVTQA